MTLLLFTTASCFSQVKYETPDFDHTLQKAQKEDKLTLLFANAKKCRPCKDWLKEVKKNDSLVGLINQHFLPFKLNIYAVLSTSYRDYYQLGTKNHPVPELLVITPDRSVLERIPGTIQTQELTRVLDSLNDYYHSSFQQYEIAFLSKTEDKDSLLKYYTHLTYREKDPLPLRNYCDTTFTIYNFKSDNDIKLFCLNSRNAISYEYVQSFIKNDIRVEKGNEDFVQLKLWKILEALHEAFLLDGDDTSINENLVDLTLKCTKYLDPEITQSELYTRLTTSEW